MSYFRRHVGGVDGVVDKPITPELVVAYIQCPRKAYVLLCTDEQGTPHDYEHIIARQQLMNEDDYIERLKTGNQRVVPYDGKVSEARDKILISATLRTLDCEAHCAALTPAVKKSSRRGRHREPALVVGTYTVNQEQQLACRFVGYVLGQLQHAPPLTGTIVTMDGHSHKVPLDRSHPELGAAVETLRKWRLAPPVEPPPVILNKHCPLCPFRGACAAAAEHDDDLSLLNRMTLKARQRYHDSWHLHGRAAVLFVQAEAAPETIAEGPGPSPT